MVVSKSLLLYLINFLSLFSFASLCSTKSGKQGTCKPISECLSIITQFESYEGFSDLTPCNSKSNDRQFCCPPTNKNSNSSEFNKLCENVKKLKRQLNPKIRAYNKNTTSVATGELPFIAQIIFSKRGIVGLGVLISETFVLTSAHILCRKRDKPIVRLGKVIKLNNHQLNRFAIHEFFSGHNR